MSPFETVPLYFISTWYSCSVVYISTLYILLPLCWGIRLAEPAAVNTTRFKWLPNSCSFMS